MKNKNTEKGFFVVEAILAVSILVMFFIVFAGVVIFNKQNQDGLSNRSIAVSLAEEGLEAVRSIRYAGFDQVPDGEFGLSIKDGQWKLIHINEGVDKFTRKIIVSSVNENKKKVISKVSWSQNGSEKNVFLETYFTNWK